MEEGKKVCYKRRRELSPPKVILNNKVEDQKSVTTYTLVGFEKDVGFLDIKEPF